MRQTEKNHKNFWFHLSFELHILDKNIRFNWTSIDHAKCVRNDIYFINESVPYHNRLNFYCYRSYPFIHLPIFSLKSVVKTLTHSHTQNTVAKDVIAIWFCHLFLSISRAVQPAVMTDHKNWTVSNDLMLLRRLIHQQNVKMKSSHFACIPRHSFARFILYAHNECATHDSIPSNHIHHLQYACANAGTERRGKRESVKSNEKWWFYPPFGIWLRRLRINAIAFYLFYFFFSFSHFKRNKSQTRSVHSGIKCTTPYFRKFHAPDQKHTQTHTHTRRERRWKNI